MKKVPISSFRLGFTMMILFCAAVAFAEVPASKCACQKLTSHGEYVLERACIFCKRDDGYFKNVVKKYIFLRRGLTWWTEQSAIPATPALVSRTKYFIHLLKNL